MATTIAVWEAAAAVLPATNPAQAKWTSGTNFPWYSLAFDPATAEKAYFIGIAPQAYAEGDVTVRLWWTSAGTLNVVWGAKYLGRIDDEVFDAALSAQTTVTDTVTAANDVMEAVISIAAPAIDKGDLLILEIERVAANAADTSASDALLLAVEIRET